MDFVRDFGYLAETSPALIVGLVVVFVAWVIAFSGLTDEPEDATDLKVEVPEFCRPGWKGRILDSPSIKV